MEKPHDIAERGSFGEILWPWLILLCAVLVYGHSLTNGYIWDDNEYVYQNPQVVSWSGLKDIWFSPKTIQYYPLTFTSFWIEHKLYGLLPSGYHTVNLLLHILNSLLLFGLLRKIAPPLAGITALLFTVHPIQVETVAWITERKNLLSFFFWLLAFHAFLRFEDTGRKKYAGLMGLCFLAALFSKTVSVCFAAVPLLYGWWRKGGVSRRDLLLTLPLAAVGGVLGAVTAHFERTYALAKDVLSLGGLERIVFVGKIFFFYLKQIALPWKFMFFYPMWNIHRTGFVDWLYPAGIIGLFLVLFLKRGSWGRGAFVLLCFYAVSIFPALGFFDLFPMYYSYVADHFSYFSVPAVLLLICGGASRIFFRLSSATGWQPSRFLKRSLAILLVLYLSCLGFLLTFQYKDGPTLWYRLLLQNPRSVPGLINLGVSLPDPSQAAVFFRKAIEIDPKFRTPYENLGYCYKQMGDYEKALYFYGLAAMRGSPFEQAFDHYQIAGLYLQMRQLDKAVISLEKVIALQNTPEYRARRQVFLKRDRYDFASEALPYHDLGKIYELQGHPTEAVEAFRKAVLIAPNNGEFKKSLETAEKGLQPASK